MIMNSNTNSPIGKPVESSPQAQARAIVRGALKGALATLDATSGHPYASLVTVATELDGTPLVLISQLALHTKNLHTDQRASLLFDASGETADPLSGGRVTLIGQMEKTDDAAARSRFLSRHPAARGYADFPDFAFYRLVVDRAHYIGGFGRIVAMKAASILLNVSAATSLTGAEADILEHMNTDHTAAVELYATALAGAPAGPWKMTGIDPEGCDLVCDALTCRIAFADWISSPALARQELARLAAQARETKP